MSLHRNLAIEGVGLGHSALCTLGINSLVIIQITNMTAGGGFAGVLSIPKWTEKRTIYNPLAKISLIYIDFMGARENFWFYAEDIDKDADIQISRVEDAVTEDVIILAELKEMVISRNKPKDSQ